MSQDAARRFYKSVSLRSAPQGFGVQLDERVLRTPGRAEFIAPTHALAEAVAREWDAQTDYIRPAAMPLTQYAFAALDHAPARRGDLIEHVAKYAETDLLCHRASAPAPLAARQQALWAPLLDWCETFIGARLPVVEGVVAARVEGGELAKLRAAAETLDDFRLIGLAQAVDVSGSAVIGFVMLHGAITPDAAFEAAALDDLWSLETWGEDAEARARLDRQRTEFDALARFFAALA